MAEVFVLGDQFVTKAFHISCYIWIGVLINGYSCGCVCGTKIVTTPSCQPLVAMTSATLAVIETNWVRLAVDMLISAVIESAITA